MRAKEVLLLILIVVLGVGLHYLDDLKLKIDDWDLEFPFRGESYLYEEQLTEAPAEILEINNSQGSIQVEGSQRPDIAIIFEKRVWRKSEAEAREVADQIKLLTTRDGNRLVLTTNRNTFRRKNFSSSFKLLVPAETRIKIRNSHGLVRVAGTSQVDLENSHGRVDIIEISGSARVSNSYEKVSIMDVAGECHLETKHSSALLSRIEGPVTIDCAHQKLELFDLKNSLIIQSRHTLIKAVRIAGPTEITGSYELISLNEIGPAVVRGHHSPIEIDEARGDLNLETSYERIKLADIQGNLTVKSRSSRVQGTRISGQRLQIETSYEPVSLEDISGQLDLKLKHASLTLAPLSLDYPLIVSTEYGNITFYWPENQTARLEARSQGGRISWQLPFTPDENTSNGTALLRAFQSTSGRPEIKLEARYGNINFLKKE
ncbi:MAG: DUF4097 family beta strand repeat-containing protein [Candidatus Saccharicenans sp.]|uniref:DUF4097 family beta strand repeat-containing protein n=1 Tax=Candidatus Saccharicenans sp. TaxID=2819258 RepID=UPI004049FFB6